MSTDRGGITGEEINSNITSNIKNETEIDEEQQIYEQLPPLPTWRKWIFPIYNHELIRLIPLNIMMFCALFSYSCFRDCKDSIVKYFLFFFFLIFTLFPVFFLC